MPDDAVPPEQPAAVPELPFNPIEVGPAVTDEAKAVPQLDHKKNGLIGAGIGLGAGSLYYLLSSALSNDANKSEKKKRAARRKRLRNAVLLGLGSGALGYAGATGWSSMRGTNFSHKYKIPDKQAEGQSPDFAIDFSGSQSGPWQDAQGYPNADVKNMTSRYGANKTIHLNPFDTKYAQDIVKEIFTKYPNARVRLSGHSMGGYASWKFANWMAEQGYPVDRLDTRDPIPMWWASDMKTGGKPKTTRLWANYRPESTDIKNSGDFWALVGGRQGKLPGSTDVVVSNPDLNDHRNIRFAPEYTPNVPYTGFPQDLYTSQLLTYYNELKNKEQP